MNQEQKNTASATLAGGCFWCLEAVYKRLKGVLQVSSGYTGGHLANPGYKEVCSGRTGHAEAVQIVYDPAQISYETLLTVFFSMHDPTTLNRQGADIGTQYRSAIFFHNRDQELSARNFIKELKENKVFSADIVTELSPLAAWYPAEDYHSNYYDLNREKNSYCTAVIDPKVNKLRKSYAHLLAEDSRG